MLRHEIKAIATSHQSLGKQGQGGVASMRGKLLDAFAEIGTIFAMSLIGLMGEQYVTHARQD